MQSKLNGGIVKTWCCIVAGRQTSPAAAMNESGQAGQRCARQLAQLSSTCFSVGFLLVMDSRHNSARTASDRTPLAPAPTGALPL